MVCKIYFCRLVPLGLWETFHNKLSGNIIPKRLVGTLSIGTFKGFHKNCGNTPQLAFLDKAKTSFVGTKVACTLPYHIFVGIADFR